MIVREGSLNPVDGIDISFFASPAFKDMDNDGDLDLFLGPYQSAVLRYFKNEGTPTNPIFTELTGGANPMDDFTVGAVGAVGIFRTVSLGDMDADGDFDIFVGTTDASDAGRILYFENVGTLETPEFEERLNALNPMHFPTTFKTGILGKGVLPSLCDIDGDGDQDMFVMVDPDGSGGQLPIYFFMNIGSPQAPVFNKTSLSENPVFGVRGIGPPSFYDIDRDGDLDMILGDKSPSPLRYYENTGSSTNPLFTRRVGTLNPMVGVPLSDLFDFPTLADIDGDGDADLFVSSFILGTTKMRYFENTAASSLSTPPFKPYEVLGVLVGGNSAPVLGDINGDGLLDMFVGDHSGDIHYFENTGTLTYPAFTERSGRNNPMNGKNVGTNAIPALGDFDGDGDLDMFVGADDGSIFYFENTAAAGISSTSKTIRIFIRRTGDLNPIHVTTQPISYSGKKAAPVLGDFDGDGDLDMFVALNEVVVPSTANDNGNLIWYYKNIEGVLTRQFGVNNPFVCANSFAPGQGASLSLFDWDGDSDLDVFFGDMNGKIGFFENIGSSSSGAFELCPWAATNNKFSVLGKFELFLDTDGAVPADEFVLFVDDESSKRSRPAAGDLNGDGIADLVVGDSTGGIKFMDTRLCAKDFTCSGQGTCEIQINVPRPISCECSGPVEGKWRGSQCSHCRQGAVELFHRGGSGIRFPIAPQCKACIQGKFQEFEQPRLDIDSCQDCPSGFMGEKDLAKDLDDGCRACPAGRYQKNEGATLCMPCLTGKFMAGTESTVECDTCPPGKFSSDGSKGGHSFKKCERCPAGWWQNGEGHGTCFPCITGKFNTERGQTSCDNCAAAKYQNQVAKVSCKDCGEGNYSRAGAHSCSQCAEGRYRGTNDGNECLPCNSSTYADQAGLSICKTCELGEYSVAGAPSCSQCAEGQYRGTNDAACVKCVAAKYQNEVAKASCKDCGEGNYSRAGAPFCSQCAEGRYRGTNDGNECRSCDPSTYADQVGLSICKTCELGEYSVAGAPACTQCAVGLYRGVSDTSCKSCLASEYSNELASSSCKTCTVGESSDPGSAKCTKCDAGTAGAGCSNCLKGEFRSTNDTQAAVCHQCAAGFYQDQEQQASCLPCIPGTYNDQLGNIGCKLCDPNFYTNITEQLSCKSCPNGSFSIRGSASCVSCAGGTAGATCDECLEGTYRSGTDDQAAICRDCPEGFYQGNEAQESCLPCIPGEYNDEKKQPKCKSCGKNEYSNVTEEKACKSCPSGKSSIPGSAKCNECPPGKISKAGDECTLCGAGQWNNETGQTKCKSIDPGHYRQGPTTQVECSAGKYGLGGNTPGCVPCEIGEFQDEPKKTSCKKCPKGSTNNIKASTACNECAPGKYAAAKGSKKCEKCPFGWLQTLPGQDDCKAPKKGAIVGGDGSTEVNIAQGWRATKCNENGQCTDSEACSAGTIGTDPPSNICKACLAGFTSFQGSLSCLKCDKGKYSASDGSDTCVECDKSLQQYADVPGMSACLECARGKVSNGDSCAVIAVDENMPVPTEVEIVPHDKNDDDDHRLNVTWKLSRASVETMLVAWFVVDLSVNPDFPTDVNRTRVYQRDVASVVIHTTSSGSSGGRLLVEQMQQQEKMITMTVVIPSELIDFPRERAVQPLWRSPRYARVRTIGNDTTRVSSFSGRSKEWVVAASCSNEEWLDDHAPSTACWRCRPCPLGASCLGTIKSTGVKSKFGFSRCESKVLLQRASVVTPGDENVDGASSMCGSDRDSDAAALFLFQRCRFPAACLGGPNNELVRTFAGAKNNSEERCWRPYLNGSRLCGSCAKHYSHKDLTGRCDACPDDTSNVVFSVLGALIGVVGCVIFVMISLSDGGNVETSDGVRAIMMSFIQLVSLLSTFPIAWPQIFITIFHVGGSVTALGQHFVNLKCLLPDYTDADVFFSVNATWALVPVFMCLCVCLVWCVLSCCRAVQDLRTKIGVSCVALLNLIWPSLCSQTFSIFACTSICQDEQTYLLADLNVPCGGARHTMFVGVVGVPMLLLYVIGLPAIA